MLDAYTASTGRFGDRLIAALRADRASGGEAGRHEILTHCYWREGGEDFANVNIMAVCHGTEKDRVFAHKTAIDAHLAAFPPGIAPVGMSAALFHPVTGYSFPDAVRLALHVADLPDLSGAAIDRAVRAYAADRWNERGFYRLLNKMLFKVAEPQLRWKVLQRFYTLRPSLVARFYAGHSTTYDKIRILTGKPPVPFWKAVNLVMKDLK